MEDLLPKEDVEYLNKITVENQKMIYVPQIAEFFRQLSKQSWQIQKLGRFYSRAWRIYFDDGIKGEHKKVLMLWNHLVLNQMYKVYFQKFLK